MLYISSSVANKYSDRDLAKTAPPLSLGTGEKKEQAPKPAFFAFDSENLLRLCRSVAKDVDLENLALEKFFDLGKSAASAGYLKDAGLPRWPKGSGTLFHYLESWQRAKELALSYAEVGRIGTVPPAEERRKEALALLKAAPLHKCADLENLAVRIRDGGESLDRLEEELLVRVPRFFPPTAPQDLVARVGGWVLRWHEGHLRTMASNLYGANKPLGVDESDLFSIGSLKLLQDVEQAIRSGEEIDRLRLLYAAHCAMRGAAKEDPMSLGLVELTSAYSPFPERWAPPKVEWERTSRNFGWSDARQSVASSASNSQTLDRSATSFSQSSYSTDDELLAAFALSKLTAEEATVMLYLARRPDAKESMPAGLARIYGVHLSSDRISVLRSRAEKKLQRHTALHEIGRCSCTHEIFRLWEITAEDLRSRRR